MNNLIGLLPAAGRGSRLGSIPCSKEIMPLGFRPFTTSATTTPIWRPITAIETHLHALRQAQASRAIIVIGETKADIVRYIGDGATYGVSVAYVYQRTLAGMPYALDLATPWIGRSTTLFSMPDTLIYPEDTMARLVAQHQAHVADVTLGLFRTTTPYKFGMVALDASFNIQGFVDKPQQTTLEWMWGLAVWSPRFTDLLQQYLTDRSDNGRECVLSDVFTAALQQGFMFHALCLDNARYHDIGTPEDFQSVVLSLALSQQET